MTARIPIRLRLGPILEVPYLDLAVAAAGAALDVSVRGLVMSKLGPISLDVEVPRLGLEPLHLRGRRARRARRRERGLGGSGVRALLHDVSISYKRDLARPLPLS